MFRVTTSLATSLLELAFTSIVREGRLSLLSSCAHNGFPFRDRWIGLGNRCLIPEK